MNTTDTYQFERLRVRLEEAQAKCAEMREALDRLVSTWDKQSSTWPIKSIVEQARKALSTDCGKGWKSPNEVQIIKAELAAKVAELTLSNAKVAEMKSLLELTEAKCAGMQEALSRVKYGLDNCSVWNWKAEVTTYPNSPRWLFHEIVESVDHAISGECGCGWRSPEECSALEKRCEEMTAICDRIWQWHDRPAVEDVSPIELLAELVPMAERVLLGDRRKDGK